ncbi:hypothetical protein [Prosthecobacter sp.]|uniref:hypothetical protein n=1 Tax=Prosthecobacter sp. TaxID=1965333 RepID=UPI00378353C6
MEEKIQKVPTGEFHSGYGCIIMSAVVVVFGFIVWWSYYTLNTMNAAIDEFTQKTPVKLAEITPVPDLQARLTEFAAQATAGKPAALKLSVADLNALVLMAPSEANGSYKDMLRVKSFNAGKQVITTDTSMPMNTKNFTDGSKRYLVGEIDFALEMTEMGPDAKPVAIRVPGKTVLEEMVKGMAMYGWLGPYQNDATTSPVLKAIKKVKVESDGVVVSTEK